MTDGWFYIHNFHNFRHLASFFQLASLLHYLFIQVAHQHSDFFFFYYCPSPLIPFIGSTNHSAQLRPSTMSPGILSNDLQAWELLNQEKKLLCLPLMVAISKKKRAKALRACPQDLYGEYVRMIINIGRLGSRVNNRCQHTTFVFQ